MTHPVIKQTREKPRAVLGVLTERIMTSQPCQVTNKVRKHGYAGATVSACVALSVKVGGKITRRSTEVNYVFIIFS